ncbi:uncharacterized protein LOC9648206 [Selaginella moellendorffii]|uniref:uncharacterized protein LOC9648206 n=1 Tax=Selaginella moellendorffii TaxID=88036 RepID=UPI000D1CCD31|nr:uncharacterized protein LOC9648206 [Selaginella moellendorffii]XP_024541503.1 uncharacterized protein LOC9648206 [Selaginella moellendorffii]|eukprot:XP_024541502.1 uncharacterized protein LOC9648206 [Selaginella moellendorffii]
MVEADYKINMHAHVAGLKRLSARANAGPALPASPGSRKVSFSFSGYGINVIERLRKCRVHIDKGLSEEEFERIEALFQFTFPPDLRGILREGLPLGDGFPNWRSGGPQQLKMWINKPRAGLLADVERGVFWMKQWGPRPAELHKAVQIARGQLKKAPVLLPVYGHCYVAAAPVRAGNPVFFVQGRDVYCCGLDVSDFFHRDSFASRSLVRSSAYVPEPVFLGDFSGKSSGRPVTKSEDKCEEFLSLYEEEDMDMESFSATSSCRATPLVTKFSASCSTETWSRSLDALACRRKSNDSSRSVLSPRSSSGSSCDGSCEDSPSVRDAQGRARASRVRRIELWSDLSEKGQSMNSVASTSDLEDDEQAATDCDDYFEFDGEWENGAESLMKETVEDMSSKLRQGGWKEEDIAEIVGAASSCSDHKRGMPDRQTVLEGLAFHLDYLSCSLRKAGWSVHDVAETLCFDFGASGERRARAKKVSPQVAQRIGMLASFVAQG